ncbi:FecR family protein [Butyricimonas faecalis]|uniref:FecR family protein n=1 Tax=Butyricimonas faecalis TaxID=2093856 RepID=UPI000D0EFDDE|nr:FecR domain-containing protein [Butyricimonas faecalis]
MKLDLYSVVELFRKSFSTSLSDEEKEELDDVLRDNYLKKAYDQLSDETFVLDKFREFEEYKYKPAFNKLKVYQHRIRIRRWTIWGSSIAAVLILVFVLVRPWKYNGNMQEFVKETQHIIPPGSSMAILKLADGRMIEIGKQPLKLKDTQGSMVKYENGRLSYSSGKETTITEAYNELVVPVGGECHVLLEDGTDVWLNADSKLKYPIVFNGESREVVLSGEAYFEVKKDNRPFIVNLESGDITVLGTSFGVSAYPGYPNYTTLVRGSVRFTSLRREQIVLTPGEQAVVDIFGSLKKRNVDVEEFVGWKDGMFIFKDKPLAEIMEILERWYGVHVIFQDNSLKELEYTGSLERYDSINTFLQLLEKLEEIQYEIKGNTIVLFK